MTVDHSRVVPAAVGWGRGALRVGRRCRVVVGSVAAAVALSASGWVAGAPAPAHADAEGGPGGQVAAPASPVAAGALRGRVIVPVWALLDGDTPLSGARVRVYAGGLRAVGRRRPLRQLRGARTERTHKTGVALLEFARLPRNFTVVISGGRSEGRRLRGFLSVRVRAYREGRVVHVNPVTTLVELWRRVNPRVSHRRATRAVERALGIPSWANNVDLRASDRWLDGERFLRHVRVHATLDRATGDLLFDIRRGRRTTRFRARRGRAGAPVARAAQIPTGLIATVFSRLAAGALEGVGSKAGGAALGWLLSAFGLGDSNDLLRQDIANIRQAIDELAKQVTQVQNRLELAGFSELVHQTDRTIGEIDHAMSQLALLTNLPADDPTKRLFAQMVVAYIDLNLLDAPSILNQNLSSNVSAVGQPDQVGLAPSQRPRALLRQRDLRPRQERLRLLRRLPGHARDPACRVLPHQARHLQRHHHQGRARSDRRQRRRAGELAQAAGARGRLPRHQDGVHVDADHRWFSAA